MTANATALDPTAPVSAPEGRRIELTMEFSVNPFGGSGYVPDWAFKEGIRELLNNGRDAEVRRAASLSASWSDGWLRIRNIGTTLVLENLLLGNSDKRGDEKTIGEHGEGLKTGVGALIRAGHRVAIRTGGEVWTPAIEQSVTFNAEVLVFYITPANRFSNRVIVEIECAKEQWEEIKDRFLYLARTTEDDRIETSAGTLLCAPRFKGRLYVKGVYVQTVPDLDYGYDLPTARLNRDRNIVEHFDRTTICRRIWNEALTQKPELADDFFKLLYRDRPDLDGMEYTAYLVSDEVAANVAARFTAKHGENAVPVTTLEESRELAHLGKRGVVVNEGLQAVVQRVFGSPADLAKELAGEAKKSYSWDQLRAGERKNLEDAITFVQSQVPGLTLGSVDVVDFRSDDIEGQHKAGRYLVARKMLRTLRGALQTLVHEVAHDNGDDGEHAHVKTIERIWSGLVADLLNTK